MHGVCVCVCVLGMWGVGRERERVAAYRGWPAQGAPAHAGPTWCMTESSHGWTRRTPPPPCWRRPTSPANTHRFTRTHAHARATFSAGRHTPHTVLLQGAPHSRATHFTHVFGAPLPLVEDGLAPAVEQVELYMGVRVRHWDGLHCQVRSDGLWLETESHGWWMHGGAWVQNVKGKLGEWMCSHAHTHP